MGETARFFKPRDQGFGRNVVFIQETGRYRSVSKVGHFTDYISGLIPEYDMKWLEEIPLEEANRLLAQTTLQPALTDSGTEFVAQPSRREKVRNILITILVAAVAIVVFLFWTDVLPPKAEVEVPVVPAAVTEAIASTETQASLPEGYLKVSAYQLHEDIEKLEYLNVTFVCSVALVDEWEDPDMGMPSQSVVAILADSETADDSVYLNWDPVYGEPEKTEIWVIGGLAFEESGLEGIPGVSVDYAEKVGEGPLLDLQVDKAKFSDAWQALAKIESATWEGVELGDLWALQFDLRNAVDRLPQDLNSDEKMCAAALGEVGAAYLDSFLLTMRKIDQRGNEGIDCDGITVRREGESWPLVEGADQMIDTYGLTVTKETISAMPPSWESYSEFTFWVVPESSISAIWAWASVRVDRLRPLLAP